MDKEYGIDWDNINHFKELRKRVDILGVNPQVIYNLDKLREVLNEPINVSPVIGAIVATKGHTPHSKHYEGKAIDVFPSTHPLTTLFTLLNFNPYNGIGFYFDTIYNSQPTVMVHLDIRSRKPDGNKTWWFRDNKHYYYIGSFSSRKEFFIELFTLCSKY